MGGRAVPERQHGQPRRVIEAVGSHASPAGCCGGDGGAYGAVLVILEQEGQPQATDRLVRTSGQPVFVKGARDGDVVMGSQDRGRVDRNIQSASWVVLTEKRTCVDGGIDGQR